MHPFYLVSDYCGATGPGFRVSLKHMGSQLSHGRWSRLFRTSGRTRAISGGSLPLAHKVCYRHAKPLMLIFIGMKLPLYRTHDTQKSTFIMLTSNIHMLVACGPREYKGGPR